MAEEDCDNWNSQDKSIIENDVIYIPEIEAVCGTTVKEDKESIITFEEDLQHGGSAADWEVDSGMDMLLGDGGIWESEEHKIKTEVEFPAVEEPVLVCESDIDIKHENFEDFEATDSSSIVQQNEHKEELYGGKTESKVSQGDPTHLLKCRKQIQQKRRKRSHQNVHISTNKCASELENEHLLITKMWVKELSKMGKDQQLYAKKAINDILFEGQMGTLHRHSLEFSIPPDAVDNSRWCIPDSCQSVLFTEDTEDSSHCSSESSGAAKYVASIDSCNSSSVERLLSDEESLQFPIPKKKRKRLIPDEISTLPWMTTSYHTLNQDLCGDEEKFFDLFCMSKSSFQELLNYIRADIVGIDTVMKKSITPEEKLAITLRYLGSGKTMTDLHHQYSLGVSTISYIIRQVCKAVWKHLKLICLPEVTESLWLETAHQFYQMANFPHCLGALAGKHIKIIKTEQNNAGQNKKKSFSILLLAVCDATYRFKFIDVGAYGKVPKGGVVKDTEFFKKLESHILNIPPPEELYSGLSTPLPFVFVADECFELSQHILRPYVGENLSQKEQIFNSRLAKVHSHIECAFGIFANKWRVFQRPLNVESSLAEEIVRVCCVLHNYVQEKEGIKAKDNLTSEGLLKMAPDTGQTSLFARDLREKFADYFVSAEGAVPGQWI